MSICLRNGVRYKRHYYNQDTQVCEHCGRNQYESKALSDTVVIDESLRFADTVDVVTDDTGATDTSQPPTLDNR